jgi:uncharacterized protein YegL
MSDGGTARTVHRPGGAQAARPLHMIWLLDTSGSMADDGKIQALNNAIRETIPHLRDISQSNPHAQILLRVVSFSTGARWHVQEPRPVESFSWKDLTADGYTDVGAGLTLVAQELTSPPMSNRSFPPALVLISDGQATDDFEHGLAAVLATPWGRKAIRASIAIGRDADPDMLTRFASDGMVLTATDPEQLVNRLQFASTIAARSSSVVAPQGATAAPPKIPTFSDGGDDGW